MRWFSRPRRARPPGPILTVEKLDVYYGRAHALQEVSLRLDQGVTAVVGKNGMGKTTLCNAITGLVPASGSVRLGGEEILGLPPNAITDRGIGYVPQGRRVWPSLTVDEHLRLALRDRSGPWTVARVYQTFPRLAERKGNGGAELSGGEQQMLAIARALLFNPILLVMDEPTEGLAPVIVQQVSEMLKRLAADGAISVLLIEQNLGVAIEVADTVDVMVNGRIARSMPSAELAADRDLQQRLLGVKVGGDEGEADDPSPDGVAMAPPDTVTVYTVRRAGDETAAAPAPDPEAPPSPPSRGGEGRVRGGRLLLLSAHHPQVQRVGPLVAGHLERLRGRPVPHVEAVRDDARTRSELAQQLRAEAAIEVGREVEGDDGRLPQIGLEEIVLPEGDAIGEPETAGPLHGLRHQRRIDLESHPARSAVAGGRDDDPPIPGPEIVDDIIGSYGAEPQHLVDHHERRPDVGDVLAWHRRARRQRHQQER